jgi:hypothetical protein
MGGYHGQLQATLFIESNLVKLPHGQSMDVDKVNDKAWQGLFRNHEAMHGLAKIP